MEGREDEFIAGPVEDVQVNVIVLVSGDAIVAGEKRPAAGGIDADAVAVQPLADFAETRHLGRIYLAIGTRADVEEKIAVASSGASEQPDAVAEGFEGFAGLPAPGAGGKRGAEFPGMVRALKLPMAASPSRE